MTRARDLAAFVSNADGDVKFDTDTLFIDSSANKVGIGTVAPKESLNSGAHVVEGDHATGVNAMGGSAGMLLHATGDTGFVSATSSGNNNRNLQLRALSAGSANANQIRLEYTGDVFFGRSNLPTFGGNNGAGASITSAGSSNGQIRAIVDGDVPLYIKRLSSDGMVLGIYQSTTNTGRITVSGGTTVFAGNTHGLMFNGTDVAPSNNSGTRVDNTMSLGTSSHRFANAYVTNGVTTGSDETEKQNIASLTSAEITAATAISKMFKTFKWKDKVAAEGDSARTHTGVMAQQINTAMSDAGLDASKYAFWCSDTWWEKDVEVAAVEADEEKDIEAADAYTRTDTYSTKDAAPEGATERTRLGIRYPELLAFIGAATEQRLTSIESRLTALEAG